MSDDYNAYTNGLIRQYLPKERDLTTVTTEEEIMNYDYGSSQPTPQKMPWFQTPYEVFFGHHFVALTS